MTPNRFNELLEEGFQKIYDVLGAKGEEYASEDDRLHNFIQAGKFKGETPAQALWGFETKHLISVNDMVQSGGYYPLEKWDEKIFDAINYLLLLRAIIVDEIPPQATFYNDECCADAESSENGATEPAEEFVALVFDNPEFESALVRAFKQAFGDKDSFIINVHNYASSLPDMMPLVSNVPKKGGQV